MALVVVAAPLVDMEPGRDPAGAVVVVGLG
jgi:hypothetical protein